MGALKFWSNKYKDCDKCTIISFAYANKNSISSRVIPFVLTHHKNIEDKWTNCPTCGIEIKKGFVAYYEIGQMDNLVEVPSIDIPFKELFEYANKMDKNLKIYYFQEGPTPALNQ